MNAYRCSSCGARAYSSANRVTVGACPRCTAPLATSTQPPVPAKRNGGGWTHCRNARVAEVQRRAISGPAALAFAGNR
jgi:predicted amidophosphoribosyltransferase